MPEYRQMYLHLFNCVTDAVRESEAGNESRVREILKRAQSETEQMYIEENTDMERMKKL